ncbi:MAG: hypothetical protein NT157_02840 [Candidatus Micrarchaeota archaeon]|nr:hypothetical protein [Candidatus Micrarchaeota archaeon]
MAVDDLLISTGVDKLVKLVHNRGRIELGQAARELALPSSSVEEWAVVLEDGGILKLEYQLTKVYLVWTGTSKEELEREMDEAADKKVVLQKDIESVLARVRTNTSELDALEKSFVGMAELLDPKLSGITKRLEALEEIEKRVGDIYGGRRASLGGIKQEFDERGGKIGESARKLGEIGGGIEAIGLSMKKLQPEIERLDPMRKGVEELTQKLEQESEKAGKALGDHRERIAKLTEVAERMKGAKKELDEINAKREKLARELGGMSERLGEVTKEIEGAREAKEELSKAGERIAEFEKERGELRKLDEKVRGETDGMMERAGAVLTIIEEQEDRFGELDDAREEIAGEVEAYGEKLAEVRKRYEREIDEMGELDEKTAEGIDAARAKLEQELAQVGEVTSNFKNVEEKKKTVDEIIRNIREMQAEGRKLSRQMSMLAREITLLNLRSEPPGGGTGEVRKAEEKVEVAKGDEADFRKRREELKGMIQKMLEMERKTKKGSENGKE